MNPEFWAGRRVFLTGHTGFKGAWLTTWLRQLGAIVTGYSLPLKDEPSMYRLVCTELEVQSNFGDVRDLPRLQCAMSNSMPEIVIHMAAQALVRESYSQPVDTFSTNVMGVVHVLQAMRSVPSIRCAVVVTTDKCYENQEWHWGYRETDTLGGYDPYSCSKACAELVCSAYRASFFRESADGNQGPFVATARAGNVIGGGDWAKDRLIPDLLTAFDLGRPALIRDPNAVRPWQFVMEPLRGYLTLAERLFSEGEKFSEAWNFGPSDYDARTVGTLCSSFADSWGNGASWLPEPGIHPHETRHLKLDISKARSRLGWEPKMGLDQTVELIVDWAQAQRAGHDMQTKTLSQIKQYEAMAL